MAKRTRADGGGSLCRQFIVPPLTVLDAKQGYWRRRKAAWLALGVQPEQGLEEGLVIPSRSGWHDFYRQKSAYERTVGRRVSAGEFDPHYRPGRSRGTSQFDPVLAELGYRWFCPPGGRVLDPFGGESVKGLVAAYLGYRYTGVELRADQVRANRRQARRMGLSPRWVTGDSARLDRLLPRGRRYDLVFTSPPYYDLERYKGGDGDGSGFGTYRQFLAWLADIFTQAAGRLRPDRFFVVKVGEIRDRRGALRNFVGDTVAMLGRCGLAYVNDAVLATAIGAAAVRCARPFRTGRKLGRVHQVVLVFFKGDPRAVRESLPDGIEPQPIDAAG